MGLLLNLLCVQLMFCHFKSVLLFRFHWTGPIYVLPLPSKSASTLYTSPTHRPHGGLKTTSEVTFTSDLKSVTSKIYNMTEVSRYLY